MECAVCKKKKLVNFGRAKVINLTDEKKKGSKGAVTF